MPLIESTLVVPVPPAVAFGVSQTTGAIRMRWDPFIRRQHFLDGKTEAARGVRTLTVHRLGFRMVSEYVSYHPPSNVGMKMLTGSWFFERLAGGWRFDAVEGDPGSTVATWKYNFACRPKWLAPLAERIGSVLLQRDIDRRIAGFARGCSDPAVLDAVGRP